MDPLTSVFSLLCVCVVGGGDGGGGGRGGNGGESLFVDVIVI